MPDTPSTSPPQGATPSPPSGRPAARRQPPSAGPNARQGRIIAGWLLGTCGLVFAMVVLGGLTRLTHSGLSMVHWRPVTGWLPPLTQDAWQHAFEAYKKFPEYQKVNVGMTLEGFQSIFWLEYLHRLLGRIIGLVVMVPLLIFAARRWLDRRLFVHLVAVLALGGLQGLVGWYMVKSGLVDRPNVSQYRLALHLVMAFVVIAYMLWLALGLLRPAAEVRPSPAARRLRVAATVVFAWAAVTVVTGAFVAGLDAGMDYNTFPLMDGGFIPDGIGALEPAYLNLLENPTAVQFIHRTFAELLFFGIVALFVGSRRVQLPRRVHVAAAALLSAALLQVSLGIATLLLVVPIGLASAHQAGSMLVFASALWLVHALRVRPASD